MISGISGVTGVNPLANVGGVPTPSQPPAIDSATTDFGKSLAQGIDALQSLHSRADELATQAATGSLADITEYMIASNEAAIATQLTTAVRDKAVAAFTSIMNMQM